MQDLKEQIRKDIDTFYRVAFSAICHCDNNPAGVFPADCECESTRRVQEAINLLLEFRKELLKKYE